MNKIIIIIFAMITVIPCQTFGQNVPNYEISINGETYDISLGRDYQIKSDSGDIYLFSIKVTLQFLPLS
jgi:hypothetical protein